MRRVRFEPSLPRQPAKLKCTGWHWAAFLLSFFDFCRSPGVEYPSSHNLRFGTGSRFVTKAKGAILAGFEEKPPYQNQWGL